MNTYKLRLKNFEQYIITLSLLNSGRFFKDSEALLYNNEAYYTFYFPNFLDSNYFTPKLLNSYN